MNNNYLSLIEHETILFSGCNYPCLMTSDKDYFGKGNIDKFDALFFRQFEVNRDNKGKIKFLTI